ncbi:MAG TPA: DUF2339 domain-containing protein [Chitinophagaceae bacterium]
MDQKEEIEQLKSELLQLNQQLKTQHQTIQDLYRRLMQLSKGVDPLAPPPPAPGASLFSGSYENFIGLRLIHLVGIVVLVIGLSIGVKYAIDRDLISEGMRIGLAYGAGVALFVLSVRLRGQYEAFSAILFSGAMASVYFTTYGAYVYYAMIPFAMAFVLMIAFTVFTVYQALSYNRKEIALLGLVGAYAIPFLISKNTDQPALFFLYITLINTAVVFLVIKRGWRLVGAAAQHITWLLFLGWASMQYTEKHQWVGLIFLVAFFALFTFNALASSIFRKEPIREDDRWHLLLNNIAVYLGAVLIMAPGFESDAIASVTLVVSLVMAAEAYALHFLWNEAKTRNSVALLALVLFVIFIAFQWEGLTVTLLWLLTAVLLFAYGIYWKSVWGRMVAVGLMGLTLLKLVAFDSLTFTTVQKVISYLVLGVLLLVVSYFYQKFRTKLFQQNDNP